MSENQDQDEKIDQVDQNFIAPKTGEEIDEPVENPEFVLTPEMEAMKKVTDIMAGKTGVHSMNYGGGPGDLFNIEKATKEGVASMHFAERAHLQTSSSGWAEQESARRYSPENTVSLFTLKPDYDFEDFHHMYGIKILLDKKNIKMSRVKGYEDGEILARERIKPRAINGIAVEEDLLNMNLERFFSDKLQDRPDYVRNTAIEMGRAITRLNIPIDDELKSFFRQAEIPREDHYSTEELKYSIDTELIRKINDLATPILVKYYEDKGILTIGDYLTHVARQAKIPVYSFLSSDKFYQTRNEGDRLADQQLKSELEKIPEVGYNEPIPYREYDKIRAKKPPIINDYIVKQIGNEGKYKLIWPKQMSHEEVKQFVVESDAAKSVKEEALNTESVDSETI